MAKAPVSTPDQQKVVLSAIQLGQIIGVDHKTISRLNKEGKVVNVGYNKFDMVASIQLYCQGLREQAAARQSKDGEIDAVAEGARLKRAIRRKKEIEAALVEGTAVTIAEVEEITAEIILAVRNIVMQWPDAVQAEFPTMERAEIEVLRRITREVLTSNSVSAMMADGLPPPLGDRKRERALVED